LNLTDKELREFGLKVTLPRLKILKILENSTPHHLRAEDIYRHLLEQSEDVGLATVYRVLAQFETAGLVKRHNFEGGHSVFELNHGDHHDHLVCLVCGKVAEFLDSLIEERQLEIAKNSGFKVTYHNHTIYGVCDKCQILEGENSPLPAD
jgi:Fur family ferric uptake transcriptional regulator